jgi:hypothetical protein
MAEQLVLLSDTTPPSWKIDQQTKEIGRDGVARARAILSSTMHQRGSAQNNDNQSGDSHAA